MDTKRSTKRPAVKSDVKCVLSLYASSFPGCHGDGKKREPKNEVDVRDDEYIYHCNDAKMSGVDVRCKRPFPSFENSKRG